jgi:hypothetical protein
MTDGGKMTVGDLRKALDGVPEHMEVLAVMRQIIESSAADLVRAEAARGAGGVR